MAVWAFFFRIFPANCSSFFVGAISRLCLPRPLQTFLNRSFVKAFGIDLSESERNDPGSFASIEDLFTRKLKHGLRPICGQFVSPCDGMLSSSQPSFQSDAMQVKGSRYSLKQLVFGLGESDLKAAQEFQFAWYLTLYLAPHNYHRVHSPFDAQLTDITYIPGFLWSVNQTFLHAVPRVFSNNERLVFHFRLGSGNDVYLAKVVMVGAFNVGRMTTKFWPNFTTNNILKGRSIVTIPVNALCKAGEEIGCFQLGSTVIVVLDEKARNQLRPKTIHLDKPLSIKVGESLTDIL